MVVIGVDAHKRTHTVVAIDGNGRKLAQKTVPTTPDGHLDPRRRVHLAGVTANPDSAWVTQQVRNLAIDERLSGALESIVRRATAPHPSSFPDRHLTLTSGLPRASPWHARPPPGHMGRSPWLRTL